MEQERIRYNKELRKKDSEREVVSEELDCLTEQYQQLESAFESQSSQLSHSNSEIEKLRLELEFKEAELDKLTQQNKERRASLSRVSSRRLTQSSTCDLYSPHAAAIVRQGLTPSQE